MFGETAVARFSRTQRYVTTSSTEGEYIPTDAAREILAVGQVLDVLRPSVRYPSVITIEDNVGAIQLARNHISSKGPMVTTRVFNLFGIS